MSEQDLVNTIIQYLNLSGAVAIRINSGLQAVEEKSGRRHVFRGAPAGTSDILCCYRGRFIAIECKVGKNKPTPAQQAFLDRVKAAGGYTIVAWTLEDVIVALAVPSSGGLLGLFSAYGSGNNA